MSQASLVPDELFTRVLRARERVRDAFDEPLTVTELARAAHLSPFHFLRVYTAAFGQTPGRDLARVRIARARDLIAGGASVTEACFAVGFSSLGSFSTRFARDVGATPREFQRAVRTVAQVPGNLLAVYVPFCFAEHFASEEAGRTEASSRIAILEKSPRPVGAKPSLRTGRTTARRRTGSA